MESSEARVTTQDQLATAVLQTAMTQHLEQYRQQILAEVSDQMRVVDSRIGAVDSRISSVEEASIQTQRDVSRLESQSREMFQELKQQSASMQTQAAAKSQFDAFMAAMAALTHSRQKDS